MSRSTARSLWNAFVAPVGSDARRTLRAAWERLAPEFRVERQVIGRQEEGCGGTIGIMPRCDFGCTGCYLGGDANATPPLSMAAARAQLRVLREHLGVWGNLQITDGEVLLRPIDEVLELLNYAHEIELVPMLMTHGDHFRREPGLLERLMVDGRLEELSIHVDITQRGRRGDTYRNTRSELELMPLRDEFANLVRDARRTTGRPLRVASTVTVTPDNLPDVPAIVQWFIDNADAFRLVSFQPAADVGRTRDGVGGGVSSEVLWSRIAQTPGLAEVADRVADDQWWFGHPDCSRMVTGLVSRQPSRRNRYEMVSMRSDPIDRRFLTHFFDRWGGITFRAGTHAEIAARVLGMIRQSPVFFATVAPRFAVSLIRRLDPEHPVRFARRLLTRTARVHPLTIGSHHFMSAAEMNTPLGRERIANCIFTVPVEGEMVSMCEVNASGVRDRLYADLRGESDLVKVTVGIT